MIAHSKILVVQDGATVDLSLLISRIRWGGRKGTPARSVEITFLDDEAYRRARSEIDIEKGSQLVFYYRGNRRGNRPCERNRRANRRHFNGTQCHFGGVEDNGQ